MVSPRPDRSAPDHDVVREPWHAGCKIVKEEGSMRYIVLACDYDGTLAHHGVVDEITRAALVRLRESHRKLVLVTGRELVDLGEVFPSLELFDYIVAENGATLYRPATQEERPLA